MRKRTAASVVAGLALALTGVSLPTTAHAAGPAPADRQTWTFDESEETVQLQDELFGSITVVPGSWHGRVVTVENAGPTAGLLTVSIVNTRGVPVDVRGDDTFFDDLLVNEIPASELEGAETVVQTTELDRGESTDVLFDVHFPREATSGNAAVVGEREFSFDVRLTLTGETDDTDDKSDDKSDDTDDKSGTGNDKDDNGTSGTATGPVASTGGVLDSVNPWLIAGAAALAAIAAIAGRPLVAAKRRRAEDSDQ